MIAMYLLALAALVAAAASRILPRAGWVYRSPGLGLAAWYAVLATILTSTSVAVLSLFTHMHATRDMVCAWWVWCVHALTGGMGDLVRLIGWVAVGLLALLAARAALAIGRAIQAGMRCHHEQLALLSLVGRRDPDLAAVVVDDPRPAAYALPGRSRTVVVTSGAVHSLPPTQLAAVLAHERAHAVGRHHLLVQVARLLVAGFPTVAVFALARAQIDRLVEMRADDVAARGHARIDLARALVACAEAATVPGHPATPAGAVAATGGDALERVQRLLTPPAPLGRLARSAVAAGLLILAATPIVLVALAETLPALAACLPPR